MCKRNTNNGNRVTPRCRHSKKCTSHVGKHHNHSAKKKPK